MAEVAPYAVRRIDLTFQLGTGEFGESGNKQLTFKGLRTLVHIELATAPNPASAMVRVYGLTLDHMNQLSQAGLSYKARRDLIQIDAGDDLTGMTTVFVGQIIDAYPDMRNQPDVSFYVFATPTNVQQLKPVETTSFPGQVTTEQALKAIAQKGGWTLEANGIKTALRSPYFQGTAWDQLLSCVRAANCFSHVDGVNNILAVWPKDGGRNGFGEAVVSPDTGMIGYPTFQAINVIVKRLFDKKTIHMGQFIQIISQLKAANGRFRVNTIDYDLSSEMPGGPWEMTMLCTPMQVGGNASSQSNENTPGF